MGNNKDALMVLIKATSESQYSNVMNVIDEMILHHVKRNAIVNITMRELDYIKQPVAKKG